MEAVQRFLGIDLSTTRQAKQGKTVVVSLLAEASSLVLESVKALHTDEELIQCLGAKDYVLCGLDAPCRLPPCVPCRDLHCDCRFVSWAKALGELEEQAFHFRPSELLIRATVPLVKPKPVLSKGGPVDLTPLTLRMVRVLRQLRRALPDEEPALIEVYASGAVQLYAQAFGLSDGRVLPYRGQASYREALVSAFVAHLGLRGEDRWWPAIYEQEDHFDALVAALTTWHSWQQQCLTPAMLLGLAPCDFERRVCKTLTSEQIEELVSFLQPEQWVFLPDPTQICRTKVDLAF